MLHLRKYQEVLARTVCSEPGNHVVVLPTGAGKTLISFEVIFQALSRHPEKIVVFLAPTILLVNQQHQELGQEAQKRGHRLQLGLLAGGKRQNLGRCHVLFATPAAAAEQVCSTEGLSSVSLLVMDEVHHAQAKKDTGRHPYALIAGAYAQCRDRRRRPKLLGLTASPAERREQTERLLEQLQAKLLHLRDPLLRLELREAVPTAALLPRLVPCSPQLRRVMVKATEEEKKLQQQLSHLIRETPEFQAVIERMKCIRELAARVRCQCWGGTAEIMGLPSLPVDPSISAEYAELLRTSTGLSPFFENLLEILRERFQEASRNEFRCIVFVETRVAARTMTQILRYVAGSEQVFAWISPDCLLGHCNRDNGESMTMAKQNQILSDFKQGKTNVMVATSVAEEGIDIPCCNLVVRMEPAHSVIQFVQARGRARFPTSYYVILCVDRGEEEMVSSLVQRETAMRAYLDDLEVSHVAENCWSTAGVREPEPLLALDPRSHDRDHLWGLGSEQIIFGEETVRIDDLMPTQATVKKTFSDGRFLLDAMLRLVQRPQELRSLPLMRAAQGVSSLLGRRSPFEDDRPVWFAADNRRCFLLKVIAPLCQWETVRLVHVNWTDEFPAKLSQCPQIDAWATDQPSIEALRNEVINRLLNDPVPERPTKFPRSSATVSGSHVFDPETDYVSMVNRRMQMNTRPSSGQHVAQYQTVSHQAPFVVEIQIGSQIWEGSPQFKMKVAKQAAAYEAWKTLCA